MGASGLAYQSALPEAGVPDSDQTLVLLCLYIIMFYYDDDDDVYNKSLCLPCYPAVMD